ncbi:MAG TPA: hypothetical protein VGZ25_09985 [Gemmataceae bacterium]|nr:hypothetical protein [Gemmataceae bacterium]
MTLWRTIGEILAHWTDTVATGVIALASRFFSPHLVRLIEDDHLARPNDGELTCLMRVKPADVHVGYAALGKLQGGKDDVGNVRLQDILAPTLHRQWPFA